jgi:Txe/YoeB family toxin of Txe-Axe toxin-antitoxin module
VSYDVRVEPQVDEDVAELVKADKQVVRAALSLMLDLRDNPWLGEELRERYNLRPLKDCRRIRFDREGWQGKPRYRLVYRNEPEDGAPAIVRVWSLGPREGLIAYTRAAARIAREQARGRRRRT